MTPPLARNQKDFKAILRNQKWLTLVGLPIMLIATFEGVYSLWGALFIYWGITSVMSGQVFLFEQIEREDDPALFWIITGMWIGSGALYIATYIATDFYPEYLY